MQRIFCSAYYVNNTIKSIIFNLVDSYYSYEQIKVKYWRKAAIVDVQLPLLDGYNELNSRTLCSGTVSLKIPKNERKYFNNMPEISWRVKYFIQPSANGDGNVIHLDGGWNYASKIIDANQTAVEWRAYLDSIKNVEYDDTTDDIWDNVGDNAGNQSSDF